MSEESGKQASQRKVGTSRWFVERPQATHRTLTCCSSSAFTLNSNRKDLFFSCMHRVEDTYSERMLGERRHGSSQHQLTSSL